MIAIHYCIPVSAHRCARLASGRIERTYTKDFAGALQCEVDGMYGEMSKQMSIYMWRQPGAPESDFERIRSKQRRLQ